MVDRSFRSSIIAIGGVTTASTQGLEFSLMNGKKMNRSLSSQNRIANGVAAAAAGVGCNSLSFIATPHPPDTANLVWMQQLRGRTQRCRSEGMGPVCIQTCSQSVPQSGGP